MNTRRPTSSAVLIPKVEDRVSSAGKKRPFPRRSTCDARRSGERRSGMTLIELAIVMGIVSLLMALVLGLARHVDATVKIRRAQAELGEWHESLNRWHLKFGEYPHARIDTGNNTEKPEELFAPPKTEFADSSDFPLTVLTNQCEILYPGKTVTFRSFLTSEKVNTVDPWGTPYIYLPSDNALSYALFSCGPDRKSEGIPTGTPSTPDPTLDDIHFER
ncbi:MAG: type II secretion system protein GspG [Kiritimatiellia bacterium]|jgi:prepilin-type N-terminal cleavage/methylation domain-containing protein|nr:type II secretion system protein GspG [Kiritimatiellia bacterium]